tara:strand:- start:809 stop:1630 length:822 start_codon:yes stop_codon:yes gene_type:complete
MSFHVFLVIIVAAFLHAIWNAMVKYEKDKYLAVGAIVLGHVPASIVIIFLTPFPSVESIPYIIISAILHIGYEWNLLSAYRFGDFTKVYPIARGTGPTLVTIISLIFLGVVLSNFETLGILIICLGIFVLAFQDIDVLKNRKAVLYAFLTGFFIMSYSVIDGYGARASFSPLSYIGWSFILNAAIFPILLIYKNKAITILKIAKEGKKIFFIGGTISYMVYAIVVWSFTQAPIPLVVALRETSIIFVLLIGFFVLKEKFTLLKTAAVLTIFLV